MLVVNRFGSFRPFTSSYPENDVAIATSPMLALSIIDVTRVGSLVDASIASVDHVALRRRDVDELVRCPAA